MRGAEELLVYRVLKNGFPSSHPEEIHLNGELAGTLGRWL